MNQQQVDDQYAEDYVNEKYLYDNHWKIYSKGSGRQKFWESPHDRKVYSTTHAIAAQNVIDQEKEEADRIARQLELQQGAENYDQYLNWEKPIDEMFPGPKKKKEKKSRSKKKLKFDRSKAIRELGF